MNTQSQSEVLKSAIINKEPQPVAMFKADDWPDDQELFVQFRLLYSGRLLGASRVDTRASLKHKIRCELSPQLKRLWETSVTLQTYARRLGSIGCESHPSDKATLPENDDDAVRKGLFSLGLKYSAENWSRAGQGFIPIVTSKMGLRCKLDILFLRPEDPGCLLKGGDLDNRIKTLFDALRLPANNDEMAEVTPQDEPIYCLFEDDRLISEVRVVADHLLMLPKKDQVSPNDVFLVIDVSLEAAPNTHWKWMFG